MTIETLSEYHCHGGTQGFYRHRSEATATDMRFGLYLPAKAQQQPLPVLYYLAGLTCTEETAAIKAGIQAHAASKGVAIVFPDTSPRGANIVGEEDDWDFGTGAGFYIDAERTPWNAHYRMQSYIVEELADLVASSFPVRPDQTGIFGHSMGGHGALTLALKFPEQYRSVSAFAPISAPTRCPWGEKAFSGYLGPDRDAWGAHDATELVLNGKRQSLILIDQGQNDAFLSEQLYPQALQQACEQCDQPLKLRFHRGYDHGYYFIQSFIGDHIDHHINLLTGG